MKNKLHYLLIGVFCWVSLTINAQDQKTTYYIQKLKEALSNVDANGKVRDSVSVEKYSELLKKHYLKNIEAQKNPLKDSTNLAVLDTIPTNKVIQAHNENNNPDSAIQNSLNCDSNIKEAIYYLKVGKSSQDSLKAYQYLQPCLDKDNSDAQLIMGRIYAQKESEQDHMKAFELIKKSAKQGNIYAMTDLGVLYKYGKGCKLNYNKARKWFKKAAKGGNEKAAYGLGYMYLKGFGSINQNYSKAVKWFKKSQHPMSRYWLGICYKKGYGVKKDIQKANELLNTNFIQNESANISSADDIKNIENNIIKIENQDDIEEEEIEVTEGAILGKWKGSLLMLDWSEKHIENKINFSLEIKKDSISDTLKSIITIGKNVIEDPIIKLDNTLYFNNSNIVLPHESYLEEIPTEISEEFLSTDLRFKNFEGINYLIGNVETYIKQWNEVGAPLRFVIKKQESFENSDKELSDDVLKMLSEQEDNFIQLYPNPFENDLIIAYKLEKPSIIKVQINDLYGSLISVIKKTKQQKKGRHRYFFDASSLKKGAYIVSVFVNNERKTRITIKK